MVITNMENEKTRITFMCWIGIKGIDVNRDVKINICVCIHIHIYSKKCVCAHVYIFPSSVQ